MIEMFSRYKEISRSIITSGRHPYIADRFREAYERIAYHHRRTTYVVPSDHILVRIIQDMSVPYHGDDADFYYRCQRRVQGIVAGLNINDINSKKGSLEKSHFFNRDVPEFLVNVESGWTWGLDASKYWQDFQPVRVVYHPYGDLTMNLRLGQETKGVKGHAVLRVDIPLLMLQYVHWRKWMEQYQNLQPTITQFVFQYPIVNMLLSDIEVSYLNHLRYMALGQVAPPQKKMYSLAVNEVTNYVEQDLDYLLKNIQKRPMSMVEIAQSIPMVWTPCPWEFLQFPKMVINAQNGGTLALGSLPWLAFFAELSYQSGSADNTEYANYLTKESRRYRMGGYWSGLRNAPDKVWDKYVENEISPYLS